VGRDGGVGVSATSGDSSSETATGVLVITLKIGCSSVFGRSVVSADLSLVVGATATDEVLWGEATVDAIVGISRWRSVIASSSLPPSFSSFGCRALSASTGGVCSL
jgi:hypothetical protein